MLATLGHFTLLGRRVRNVATRRYIISQHPHLAGLQWDPLTSVIQYDKLRIGHGCSIGGYAYLSGPITLGDDVMIALHVGLSAGAHRFDIPGRTIRDSGGAEAKGIVIENDVWLGHGVFVIDGVTIGEGSVVAGRSVVLTDVPPYTVVGGHPARILRPRFSESPAL